MFEVPETEPVNNIIPFASIQAEDTSIRVRYQWKLDFKNIKLVIMRFHLNSSYCHLVSMDKIVRDFHIVVFDKKFAIFV